MPTFLMVGKVTQRTVNFDADNQLVSVCPTCPLALFAELAVAIKHVTNEGRQEPSHPRTSLRSQCVTTPADTPHRTPAMRKHGKTLAHKLNYCTTRPCAPPPIPFSGPRPRIGPV